jgi:hypothetical protein
MAVSATISNYWNSQTKFNAVYGNTWRRTSDSPEDRWFSTTDIRLSMQAGEMLTLLPAKNEDGFFL